MKYINRPNKLVMIVFIAISILGVTSVSAAKVASVSGGSSVNIDGQEYQSVSVKCRNASARPILLKRKGERQWCDSVFTSECSSEKVRAAQFVCSSGYSRKLKQLAVGSPSEPVVLVEEKKLAVSVNNDVLNAEKLKIENAILAIKARRLVLSHREADLLKKLDGA